jgi:hypothetical protein
MFVWELQFSWVLMLELLFGSKLLKEVVLFFGLSDFAHMEETM